MPTFHPNPIYRFFYTLLLLFIAHIVAAQPSIQWQQTLGTSNDDNTRGMLHTKDGGYIVVGNAVSLTTLDGDFWIVKLDKDGRLQWDKKLGGSGWDVAYSIDQTKDGGYIVAGYSESTDGMVTGNHGANDFWIVKLDANGNTEWQKALGGSESENPHCVIQTKDGGYIVAGNAYSTNGDVTGNHGMFDGWVVKLDSKGQVTWKKCYGGNGLDDIDCIQEAPGGGYIMTGYTTSKDGPFAGNKGKEDLWLLKIDVQGNLLWQKTLGGSSLDVGKKITVTSDGGYILAGITQSNNGDVSGNKGDYDGWILKLDAAGQIQWQKCLGGSGVDMAVSVYETSDHHFIAGIEAASGDGDVTGNQGDLDYWIVRLKSNGQIVWQKSFGGSGADMMSDLVPTNDGWFAACGSTNSPDGDVIGLNGSSFDYWMVKFSNELKCAPKITISNPPNVLCPGSQVTLTATIGNGGTNEVYRWTRNNSPIGTNSSIFKDTGLKNGDIIACTYSCKTACGNDTTITSNSISIEMADSQAPTVSIVADKTSICAGGSVTFTATDVMSQATSALQWLVNGNPTGINNTTFSSSTLPDNATIQCIITNMAAACPDNAKGLSNIITVQVQPITSPAITIATNTTQLCKGSQATFFATSNGGPAAAYQWLVNELPAGSNSPSFTISTLQHNDKVSCMLRLDPNSGCFNKHMASSNEIKVSVAQAQAPSVNISASALEICSGEPVTFTAVTDTTVTIKNYQWKVNSLDAGGNTQIFRSSTLVNGAQVSCQVTAEITGCSLNAVGSNLLTVKVKEVPVISFPAPELTLMSGQQTNLNPAVKGNLSAFEWSPANALVDPRTLNPYTIPLNSDITYRLKVVDTNGCTATKEIVVKVFKNFFMPTSFTPDGNGVNDVFKIPGKSYIELEEFSVYDRWGVRVFTTKDRKKGWDGTLTGQLLNPGVFVYSVSGIINGNKVLTKGTVMLIR